MTPKLPPKPTNLDNDDDKNGLIQKVIEAVVIVVTYFLTKLFRRMF